MQVLDGQSPEKLEEELEDIKRMLSERIDIHDESRNAAQERLHEICEELRAQVDKLGEKTNSVFEEKFTAEDNRLQTILSGIRSDEDGNISKKIQKAKAELLVEQTYDVIKRNPDEKEDGQKLWISSMYELKTDRKVALDIFEMKKPANLVPSFTEKGELSLSFAFFNEEEEDVLKEFELISKVEVKVWEKNQGEDTSRTFTKELTLGRDESVWFRSSFSASTVYFLKMRILHQGTNTKWSDEAEFTTPEFKKCYVWNECPDDIDKYMKYSVDEKNSRIATKIGYGNYNYDSTIIGSTPLPLNKVTSWNIKILKSRNDGGGIWIGVAPTNIDQNIRSYNKCGWYFNCYWLQLWSGPPHNYSGKEYGPRKRWGEYVHTGDSVGVVMDTAKGELSFALDGVNLSVAYDGIPLDKPLVPCVIFGTEGDSVELVI